MQCFLEFSIGRVFDKDFSIFYPATARGYWWRENEFGLTMYVIDDYGNLIKRYN